MRPRFISGTSPPPYASGSTDMSSVPLRIAPNWLNVFTSDPFGYTSSFSCPLVRFSTSAANFLASWSRKSPSLPVEAGNWCEILMTLGACARVVEAKQSEHATTSALASARCNFDVMKLLLVVDCEPAHPLSCPADVPVFGRCFSCPRSAGPA